MNQIGEQRIRGPNPPSFASGVCSHAGSVAIKTEHHPNIVTLPLSRSSLCSMLWAWNPKLKISVAIARTTSGRARARRSIVR